MEIKVISSSENKETKWSGGITREVFIYPENADYAKREFLFRLSMAQAYDEDSAYTSLPGVTRYLVSLDGTAELFHADKEDVVMLTPFGYVDCFDGGVHTRAHGAIRDFNLMLCGADGKMSVVHENVIETSYTFNAIYADAKCTVSVDEKRYALQKGDCLMLCNVTEKIKIMLDGEYEKAIFCGINV
ncbi:MAG: HutD family protein [Clostridia bacterium]|nr:HutD family protein [Clostridia bacterium]